MHDIGNQVQVQIEGQYWLLLSSITFLEAIFSISNRYNKLWACHLTLEKRFKFKSNVNNIRWLFLPSITFVDIILSISSRYNVSTFAVLMTFCGLKLYDCLIHIFSISYGISELIRICSQDFVFNVKIASIQLKVLLNVTLQNF